MKVSIAESLANAIIGLIISWLATWLVLGFTPSQAIGITALFFGLSFCRAFILREIFRRIN